MASTLDTLAQENEELVAFLQLERDSILCNLLQRNAAALRLAAQAKRLAPVCDEHGKGDGSRTGCPYCALDKLAAALSRIDYLCGEPNEMEVSGYDVHYNEDAVVKNVQNALKRGTT